MVCWVCSRGGDPRSRGIQMLLEAKNVSKVFGSFTALDSATVEVEEGEILGLIGPNGAGKSTFFNCLTGDIQPTAGSVMVAGGDAPRRSPEARASRGLARTFQLPQTFGGMTVLENVMVGAFLRTGDTADARRRAS